MFVAHEVPHHVRGSVRGECGDPPPHDTAALATAYLRASHVHLVHPAAMVAVLLDECRQGQRVLQTRQGCWVQHQGQLVGGWQATRYHRLHNEGGTQACRQGQ